MINGIRKTEVALVRERVRSHQRRIRQLTQNNSPQSKEGFHKSLSSSQEASFCIPEYEWNRLNKQKQVHVKALNWRRLKKEQKIENENSQILSRLLEIDNRKNSDYAQKFDTTFVNRTGKYENLRKRQSEQIEQSNVEIANRIMSKTGYIDHSRDLKDFGKSREIVNRLQKFQEIDRMIDPSQKKRRRRLKSLPSQLPSIGGDKVESESFERERKDNSGSNVDSKPSCLIEAHSDIQNRDHKKR